MPLEYWEHIPADFGSFSQLLYFMGWESNSFCTVVPIAFSQLLIFMYKGTLKAVCSTFHPSSVAEESL